MRGRPVMTAGALLALALPAAALAQVTVNPGALNALPAPERRAPARPQNRTTRNAPQKPSAAAKPGTPAPSATAPAKTAKPEKPAIPPTPPAILALPPPVPVPLAHPPPAPTIPVSPDAAGAATPMPNGLRVTFGADSADLNPATESALRAFARDVKDKAGTAINLYAYAAGSSEDPSTPRRLSLARALAARAVLMAEGVPSARIYPRALGPAGGDAARDRVDVLAGPPAQPPPSAAP